MSSLTENSQPLTSDFAAERLTLMFNLQAQHEYFNDGPTISMEGIAINFFQAGSSEKIMKYILYLRLKDPR